MTSSTRFRPTSAVSTSRGRGKSLSVAAVMIQVIAGVALAQAAQPVPHPAVGQHHFEAERELARVAVAQHVDAAGIGREIAADLARALGAQAEREQPVGRLGGALQIGENAAGLGGDGEVERIERPDAVHPAEVDEDAVLRSDGAARQTGIAALRIDRQVRRGADRDQLRHLVGRGRPQHGERGAAIEAALFVEIGLGVGALGDALRPDHGLEARDRIGGCDGVHG
jgi:hypothetical protein